MFLIEIYRIFPGGKERRHPNIELHLCNIDLFILHKCRVLADFPLYKNIFSDSNPKNKDTIV